MEQFEIWLRHNNIFKEEQTKNKLITKIDVLLWKMKWRLLRKWIQQPRVSKDKFNI